MFYSIQILGCNFFEVPANYPLQWSVFFCGYNILLWASVSGDYFPWNSHVSWDEAVSLLIRHLQGPTVFKSFWVVLMLASQLGSLYHENSGNLEPSLANWFRMPVSWEWPFVHLWPGFTSSFPHQFPGWLVEMVLYLLHGSSSSSQSLPLQQLNSIPWALQPTLPSTVSTRTPAPSWFHNSVAVLAQQLLTLLTLSLLFVNLAWGISLS